MPITMVFLIWSCKHRNMERSSELIVSEDEMYYFPLRVDIPMSCQGVQLSSEVSRAKAVEVLGISLRASHDAG